MSFTKIFMAMIVVAAFTSGVVLANERKDGASGKPGGPAAASSVSWEEFRDRCLRPTQYEVQKAPENIRIQCVDTSSEFVPAAAGEIPLAAGRMVVTTVVADKFYVAAGAQNVAVAAKGGTCLRFKEVEKTLAIERPMSCAEVVGMKGDPAEYCQASLDAAKSANPKLMQVRDTGRTVDTCGGVAGNAGKDDRK
ncbi:MAG: hypothetical protein NDJ89_01050 [Oligoflexia bacterium]|nr:hypothetical protein [Oligoflexia bacterium]